MLHSFQTHYACYYALLCLFYHHSQQVASVTIIIDGATTNEWATRDEYQRLVESSQGPLSAGADSGLAPLPADSSAAAAVAVADRAAELELAAALELQHLRHEQQRQQQEHSSRNWQSAGAETERGQADVAMSSAQRLLSAYGDSGEPATHLLRLDQLSSLPSSSSSSSSSSSQLDQKDLIEQEQRRQAQRIGRLHALERVAKLQQQQHRQQLQQQQQQQLQQQRPRIDNQQLASALELMAESGLGDGGDPAAIDYNGADSGGVDDATIVQAPIIVGPGSRIAQQHHKQQADALAAQAAARPYMGARSISDLTATGDDDLDLAQRLKERNAKKMCGTLLMDTLDLVCQGKFYGGEVPLVVQPSIKSKRDTTGRRRQLLGTDSARDNLHTPTNSLASDQSDSDAISTALKTPPMTTTTTATHFNNNDGGNSNHNHKQQKQDYLTPSSSSSSSAAAAAAETAAALSLSSSTSPTGSHLGRQSQYQQVSDHKHHHTTSNNMRQMEDMDFAKHAANSAGTGKVYNSKSNYNNDFNDNLSFNQQPRNRQDRKSLFRRIRGAHQDCCEKVCELDQLKAYCQS